MSEYAAKPCKVCKCTPIEACDDCHREGLHYGEEE